METIKTNHHWRKLFCGCDLPTSVIDDFDYIQDIQETGLRFFKYGSFWYDVHQFQRIINEDASKNNNPFIVSVEKDSVLSGWNGMHSDGVLIKIDSDAERVLVGTLVAS